MTDHWKKIVNSPEASALLKLVLHIHTLCDHEGEVTEFLPTMLHQLAQLLDVQTAAVTVKDQDTRQRLLARYDRGSIKISDEVLLNIGHRVTTDNRKLTQSFESKNIKNLLAAPISKSNNVLGAFVLANKTSGDFSEYDDIVVTLVEARMDSVIHEWVKRQEHRLISLENRVMKTLDDIRDDTDEQGDALDKMIETVLDSVGAQIGFITLYDADKDRHLPGGKVMRGARPMSQNDYKLIGNIVRQAKEEHQSLLRHNLPNSEIDSTLVVPMFVSGRFLGATVLINKADGSHFTFQDLTLVESVNRIIDNYIFQTEKVKRLSQLIGPDARRDVEEVLMGHRPDKSTGQRMDITMLFADIRNYSKITKDMDPTTTVRMLNDFFSVVTPIVIQHGGMIDKYVGDELVALFTQSNPTGSHDLMGVEAALKMQDELKSFNKEWEATGRPTIDIGIGVHSGEVVLGQIGSYDRKDYTAIGANMNFAARLMSVAGPRQIIISERTFLGLNGKIAARRVGPFDIKGFGEMQVFLVEGYTPDQF
jgi:class 3 adenylate cyclase